MRFISKITLFCLLLLIVMVSCSSSPRVFKERGLVTGQPGINIFHTKPPGETTNLKRPYIGALPLVPHDIVEFIISRAENECLDCHFDGLEIEHGGHVAIKAPLSHYINEFSKVQTKEQVVGIRYNCLQCHVPQSEEEPLVSQMKLD